MRAEEGGLVDGEGLRNCFISLAEGDIYLFSQKDGGSGRVVSWAVEDDEWGMLTRNDVNHLVKYKDTNMKIAQTGIGGLP